MNKKAILNLASMYALMGSSMYLNENGTVPSSGYTIQQAIEDEQKRRKEAIHKQKEIDKANGLKQWPEYGDVWAATKKAAIKKYNKLKIK